MNNTCWWFFLNVFNELDCSEISVLLHKNFIWFCWCIFFKYNFHKTFWFHYISGVNVEIKCDIIRCKKLNKCGIQWIVEESKCLFWNIHLFYDNIRHFKFLRILMVRFLESKNKWFCLYKASFKYFHVLTSPTFEFPLFTRS